VGSEWFRTYVLDCCYVPSGLEFISQKFVMASPMFRKGGETWGTRNPQIWKANTRSLDFTWDDSWGGPGRSGSLTGCGWVRKMMAG
jgi:hypothetical protein